MSVSEGFKVASGYQTWTRPADWLALATINPGDQKISALVHALPGEQPKIGFTIAGAYTVDWGDGSAVQNFATGVQATHTYDYATMSSVTSDGYRQAVLTVTMQAANTMTSVNLNVTPTGTTAGYTQPFRDIAMAGSSVSSLTLAGSNGRNQMRLFSYIGTSAITSLQNTFGANCPFLRTFTGTTWTALVTSFASAFSGMASLESIPLIDTSMATDVNAMFSSCPRLRSVPLLNTGNVTNFTSMFNGCSSLTTIPLFDTSKGTNFTLMFSACVSLTTIPLLVTTAGVTFTTMFTGCSSLASIPAIDVGNGTAFAGMFTSCSSLTTFAAALNTIKGTDVSSMFSNCVSMVTHPTVDFSNATLCNSIFQGCTALSAISLNTPKAVTFANLMFNCQNVRSVSLDCTLIPSTAAMSQFLSGSSVSSLILTGLRFAPPTLASQQMSATALNALYTSLGTASGAQTIIVSSNPGSGSSTISIASTKGWTVTGG